MLSINAIDLISISYKKGFAMQWQQLRRNQKQFLCVCVGPLLAIILISAVLAFTISPILAIIISDALLAIWMLGSLGYVVFVDSKSRWPDAKAFQRFTNVITFKR